MGLSDDALNAVESLKSLKQSLSEYIEEKAKDPRWQRFDPESPQIIKDIEEWGQKTTFGILGGMLYGGMKEGAASAHWQPLLPSQSGSKTWNERQELWKKMWEQRMLRVAGGTVRGGAKLGSFTAMFCGLQRFLEIYRDENDTFNTVGAACTTTALIGIALPGTLRWRIRTSLLGVLLGGVLGFPLGYLHSYITEQQRKQEELRQQQEEQQQQLKQQKKQLQLQQQQQQQQQ